MRKKGKVMNENKEIRDILREILKWTKITSIPKVKELLLEILTTPEEKIAYQSSNGEKTIRELGNLVNKGKDTIAKWWKTWIKAGIAEPVSVKGGGKRARMLFPLMILESKCQ